MENKSRKISIESIPTNILEDIFYSSLPFLFDGPDGIPNIHPQVEEDPEALKLGLVKSFFHTYEGEHIRSNLMLVCRSWKDIVLFSAKIWSRLEINTALLGTEPRRLKYLLNRSKNHSLDVKLSLFHPKARGFSENSPSKFSPEANIVGLSILREHFPRIRILGIDCRILEINTDYYAYIFPKDTRINFPRLEYLFNYGTEYLEDLEAQNISRLSIGCIDAPQLHTCYICWDAGFWWKGAPCYWPMALRHASLTLVVEDVRHLEDLLSSCSSLRTLTLTLKAPYDHDLEPEADAFPVIGSLNFPDLKSLCVDSSQFPIGYEWLGAHLRTPRLNCLVLCGSEWTPITYLESLLRGSRTVRHLRLHAFDFNGTSAHSVLKCPLKLNTLIISGSVPRKEFLQPLFLPQNDQYEKKYHLLSDLESFVIEKPGLGFSISKTLIHLIKYTLTSSPRPPKFHIWSEFSHDLTLIPNHAAFMELVKEHRHTVYWHEWKNPDWYNIQCGNGRANILSLMKEVAAE